MNIKFYVGAILYGQDFDDFTGRIISINKQTDNIVVQWTDITESQDYDEYELVSMMADDNIRMEEPMLPEELFIV
jgi:hypothetical protein